MPFKVLFGSTNFSFRGIYIQANNALVFYAADVAALFARAFQIAFAASAASAAADFAKDAISTKWHLVHAPGKPLAHFCFSPHSEAIA